MTRPKVPRLTRKRPSEALVCAWEEQARAAAALRVVMNVIAPDDVEEFVRQSVADCVESWLSWENRREEREAQNARRDRRKARARAAARPREHAGHAGTEPHPGAPGPSTGKAGEQGT